jgi:hypothetical protein
MGPERDVSEKAGGGGRILPALRAGFAVVMGIAILGAGATLAARGLRPGLRQIEIARSWQPVQARVVATQLRRSVDYSRITYEPVITFQYWVNNAPLASSTYRATGAITDSQQRANDVLARYKPGGIYGAWFNPKAPLQAVLDKDVRYAFLIPLAVGIIVLAPLGIAITLAGLKLLSRGDGGRGGRRAEKALRPELGADASAAVFDAVVVAVFFTSSLVCMDWQTPGRQMLGWVAIAAGFGIWFLRKATTAMRAMKQAKRFAGMELVLATDTLAPGTLAKWRLLDPQNILAGPAVRGYIVYSRGVPDVATPAVQVDVAYREAVRAVARVPGTSTFEGQFTLPPADVLPLETSEVPGRWYFAVTDGGRQAAFALEMEAPAEGAVEPGEAQTGNHADGDTYGEATA